MFLQQNKGAGAARTIEGDRGGINVLCMCARRAAGGFGRGYRTVSEFDTVCPRGMSADRHVCDIGHVCALSAGYVCGTLP